jgi:hypothetical protein
MKMPGVAMEVVFYEADDGAVTPETPGPGEHARALARAPRRGGIASGLADQIQGRAANGRCPIGIVFGSPLIAARSFAISTMSVRSGLRLDS